MSSIVILLILLLLVVFILFKLKVIKCNSVNMFTGSPKTGKSTLAIWCCVFDYKLTYYSVMLSNFFKRFINYTFLLPTTFFCKQFYLVESELPILYSNIPIYIKQGYSPLTEEILKRQVNPVENSRFYIGEFSLVANSMDFKDMVLNEEISLFFKLIGHQCKGKVFVDTQSIQDNHFGVRRCVNQFNYIHSSFKIPFFVVMRVRELIYMDGMDSATNSFNSDIEETLKVVFVPKLIWRSFDYRCYKVLTKNNPVQRVKIYNPDSLSSDFIVSFRQFLSIDKQSYTYNDLMYLLDSYESKFNKECSSHGKKSKKM